VDSKYKTTIIMKKLYFLLVTLLVTTFSFGQVFITELADPNNDPAARYIELYNAGSSSVDLSTWRIDKYTNGSSTVSQTLTLTGTIDAGDFYIIATGAEDTVFFDYWGFNPNQWDGADNDVAGSNGDDNLELYDGGGTLIDQFGVPGEDGSGTNHEFEDGRAERAATVTTGNPVWDVAEWNIDNDSGGGDGTQNAPSDFDPGQWIGTASSPTIIIDSPSDGTEYNPEVSSVDITISILNFTVANGTGDGYIMWDLNGGTPTNKYDTTPINLSGLTPGTYNFFIELVDNSGASLSPVVETEVNFTIQNYTDVANLADLRAGTIGQYYRVTGEIFGTYAQNYRNQKWAQDATAGILIDDVAGVISTVYNEGDGVTNLRGKLGEYNGTMQLVPSADPGAPTSTGTIITPEMVSIADLAANGEDYESELVQISEPVSFADGDGTAVFATGTIYVVNGASEAYNMRTSFYDADYIGAVIPDSPVNLAGIITERSGNAYFITPRAMGNDMNLGVNQQPIEGFGLYPNPVNNGVLSIITQDNLEKNIQIFNVLGKQVFAQTTSGSTINVSSLNSGIYIIRVEEAGRLATRKLVIE